MISELGQSDYHPGICLEALGKTMETYVRRVGVPSGVRSRPISNMVPLHHRADYRSLCWSLRTCAVWHRSSVGSFQAGWLHIQFHL